MTLEYRAEYLATQAAMKEFITDVEDFRKWLINLLPTFSRSYKLEQLVSLYDEDVKRADEIQDMFI